MRVVAMAVPLFAMTAIIGCAHKQSERNSPTPTTAARPAGGEAGRAGGPGGPPGTRRAPQPPNWERQDSVRKALMAEVLSTIPGRENEPAGKVFKSVKLNRNMPVKEFLTMMDEQYGRSVGASCTGCHANQNVNGVLKVNYADDSPKKKMIARQMEEMTQNINRDLKKNKGIDEDYPKATCVMCHRGAEHMPNTMKQLKNSDPPPPTRQRG